MHLIVLADHLVPDLRRTWLGTKQRPTDTVQSAAAISCWPFERPNGAWSCATHDRMSTCAIRVAVVEDDASVRKALTRLLSACSFDVQTYASAREFMKAGFDDLPACLIVDLQMPDITGLELRYYLRRVGSDIPTIIISAYNDPGLRERCQFAGASTFLLKPFNQQSLVGAINTAIGRGKI